MNAKQRQQLAEWVERQLDERLSADDFLQLQQLLQDDSEARQLYLDLRQQHAHLLLDRRALDRPSLETLPSSAHGTPVAGSVRTKSTHRQSTIVVSMAAIVCLLMIWWTASQGGSGAVERLAEIVGTSDARWGDSSLPTAVGSVLGRGRLKIDRGLVVLRFRSGAEVTLEAPAELQIESRLSGRLLSGTALLQVPESAHGFTLHTPTGPVTAWVYVSNPDSVWSGVYLPHAARAEVLAAATPRVADPYARGADYLVRTVHTLARADVHDPQLDALVQAVRRILGDRLDAASVG